MVEDNFGDRMRKEFAEYKKQEDEVRKILRDRLDVVIASTKGKDRDAIESITRELMKIRGIGINDERILSMRKAMKTKTWRWERYDYRNDPQNICVNLRGAKVDSVDGVNFMAESRTSLRLESNSEFEIKIPDHKVPVSIIRMDSVTNLRGSMRIVFCGNEDIAAHGSLFELTPEEIWSMLLEGFCRMYSISAAKSNVHDRRLGYLFVFNEKEFITAMRDSALSSINARRTLCVLDVVCEVKKAYDECAKADEIEESS